MIEPCRYINDHGYRTRIGIELHDSRDVENATDDVEMTVTDLPLN